MRVALLMNFVPPYRVPLFEHLRDLVGEFRVLVSTPMETDRHWIPDWGTLDVVLQRNITLKRTLRDAAGFSRIVLIHVPYDTIPQLRRYRPDAIFTCELGMRSVQAAVYRWLNPAVPLIVWCTLSEHTERNWGRLRRVARRFIFGRADAVFVNGESGARYVARFGVPDERIIRLNQPIDVARFAEARRTRPPPSNAMPTLRLLHVGQLIERKGVVPFSRHLVEWAARHPDRLLEIVWLGDGDQRTQLEATDWPANLRAAFHGNLPYGDVPGIYADSDILVFPTLSDEWGLVVNEAMACGLPVLGSIYSQAVDELVVEDRSGWRFDPLDAGDVMRAFDRVFGTPPERLAWMRTQAQQRVAGLTPQATARRMMSALQVELGKRRPFDFTRRSLPMEHGPGSGEHVSGTTESKVGSHESSL